MKQPADRAEEHSTRRRFLGQVGLATIVWITPGVSRSWAATKALNNPSAPKARSPVPRPDLLDENSPKGLEILQLTAELDVPSSHLYMEAQVFTPDSKRFILHRSQEPEGRRDRHQRGAPSSGLAR
jgi:hypothetical protein